MTSSLSRFDLLGFDADDTLWHNERLYSVSQEKLRQVLAEHAPAEVIDRELFATETANMDLYGYGIKAFTLSMLETALRLSQGNISAVKLAEILGYAKEMISADVHLFEGVEPALQALVQRYELIIITKGDPIDQERKLHRSGLAAYFSHIETVSHKAKEVYARILKRNRVEPERFLMIGDSLRSDILPVIELGGQAVYIPHSLIWAHEVVSHPVNKDGYHELESISELPELVERLERQES